MRRFLDSLSARPLRQKIALAVLAPLLPAVLAAILVLYALLRATSLQGEELEASARVEAVERLLRLVIDAETGERGFVLTGDERFLESFDDALETIPEELARLTASCAGDRVQLERLQRIGKSFGIWRDEVALPIVEARRRIPGAAPVPEPYREQMAEISGRIARQEGKRRIDEIRRQVAEFQSVGRDRVRASLTATESAQRTALTLLALGGVGVVALVVWSATTVSRRATSSLAALGEAAGIVASGNFAHRVPVVGNDELAVLAASFNEMAERIQKRRMEREARQHLSDLVQGCSRLDEATDVLARLAPQLLPRGAGCVYLISASRSDMVLACRFGEGAEELGTEFAPEECWALRRAHRYEVRGGTAVPCPHARSSAGDTLCLPLANQAEVFGLLHFGAPVGAATAEVDELFANATALAFDVSLAFGNLNLRQTLRDQSIRDPLTGLFNRRYFDETFERELQRARRSQRPLALLMADLDHFKRFNDQFGHEAGDLVLKEVGSLMRTSFRAIDVACRLGGEELAVLLPDSSAESIAPHVEGFLEALRKRDLALRGQELGRVTISAGLASFPQHAESIQGLLHAADRALYEAKHAGRDRIVVAG